MDEPSAKRQKVSPIEGSENDNARPTRSQPTTPTSRASYQSPTKASLARSHPALLARSPGRDKGQTQTRGRNLRMSLLGNSSSNGANQNKEGALSAPHTPRRGVNITANAPLNTSINPSEGFSAAVTRAFADNRPTSSVRSPLTTRQPSASVGPQNEDDGIEKSAFAPFMRPKLVSKTSSFNGNDIRPDSSEPELPPTPVQLGLEPPPERPRGLGSSSSPRGPKADKQRSRLRGNVTSSPLKPKDKAPEVAAAPAGSPVPRQVEVPREAPETGVEEPVVEDEHETVPDDIKEKQSLRTALRAELAKLKSDMRRLETAVASNNSNIDPRTLKLLTATPVSARSESPTPILPNPVDLPTNPLPHLTLFAPGSLQLRTTTQVIRPTSTTIQQIHSLTITPPHPYPPHIFGAVLTVHANPLTTQIEKVELSKWHPASHAPLRRWVDARLAHPVHRHDVAGLVWGMGSYWEFCMGRAKMWIDVQERWGGEAEPAQQKQRGEIEKVISFLKKENMVILVPKTKKGKASLLLVRKGELDWSGEVEERVGFSSRGLPEKVHGRVGEVFEDLRRGRGVLGAVEGVLSVLEKARVRKR